MGLLPVFVSIQLMSPASGNKKKSHTSRQNNVLVSIQLMSPASGNLNYIIILMFLIHPVSIQLMSPASGNNDEILYARALNLLVSIQLMSPASGNLSLPDSCQARNNRFHSINVPSEWERSCGQSRTRSKSVSIQLMSPASGNIVDNYNPVIKWVEFPFN